MENLKMASNLADRSIHIKIPVSVAFDLQRMNKATALVLDRLGCPECHSGFDLRFDLERQFIFNERVELINQL